MPRTEMTLADAKPNDVVELLYGPEHSRYASGRIFKVDTVDASTGMIGAYARFRQGFTLLHPFLPVRDLSNDVDRPTWRF